MNPHQRKATSGFTLVELLVAAAIGAALIASAVIGFGVISSLPLRDGTVNVSLPSGVIGNFYGTNFASLTLGPNPNYFQAAQARRMKDLEKENARLRRAISDLTLDKLILQEAARGSRQACRAQTIEPCATTALYRSCPRGTACL
jgi:prepilin-type N-terminal cleavage/methylation domain-containing protein